uniref:[heparan sulfate]-glucosamine N-sulfotransferase n=1 Tax=Phallusia mammillata TaxID=59560 RepID=A0A6F9DLC2_9ASCI|nr:bifunctional heparan sulfate N-deacetylase/N-sulfotransferase 4 [Phallusia mammillata]
MQAIKRNMWMKVRKIASPRNIVFTLTSLATFSVFYMFIEWQNRETTSFHIKDHHSFKPVPDCSLGRVNRNEIQAVKFPENTQTRQKALLFLKSPQTQMGRKIVVLLESARFKFNTQNGEIKNLPVLIDDNKGRYGVIIFEDMLSYTGLHQWNRDLLDKYCRDFNVGIVSFLHPKRTSVSHDVEFTQKLGNFPLNYASNLKVKDYELNATAGILRIARPAEIITGVLPNDWTVFEFEHNTYAPVSTVRLAQAYEAHDTGQDLRWDKNKARPFRQSPSVNRQSSLFGLFPSESVTDHRLPAVVQDLGKYDQVERVIFGEALKFWLHQVLFLDAISYLSRGRLALPLERNVQIDIDDMFVGVKGTRMTSDDVTALLNFQEELRETIPGFSFQLGFSGKFIFHGEPEETEAERLLLKLHDKFQWFPHMWSHMQAHWFKNVSQLCSYMDINRQFAVRHKLNMSHGYAVSPHHAGVYPVHQPLYDCWHRIWNITTTSTEEYPHLRPDHKRRGFIHDNIKVLPRQTCGLFTHTMILDKYPGGPTTLHENINGGLLFQTFLFNQFNIYMTHLSNYGNDRLAIYTFRRAIKFVQCWTNLQLRYDPPEVVGRKYFELYPEEKDPLWTNPCLDKRHKEIYSEDKTCDRLPNFVVVGPQKTGTTALYWFLNMHPDVESNRPSDKTFEEVQFFSGTNYYKGIDWYMDYFPVPSIDTILFEKSATYFDQEVVPRRVAALLPKSHVVVILIDPAKRAYSWYQHMRSHDDPTALKYSFYQVVNAKRQGSPPALISLQRRCLDPGFYAYHLERWTDGRRSDQIVIVDGEMLKEKPAVVMQHVQKALGFKNIIDYSKKLKFDQKKGFFCQVTEQKRLKCLGKSKGRLYPDMDDKSQMFLTKYYQVANTKLLQMLKSMNKPVPKWLEEQQGS